MARTQTVIGGAGFGTPDITAGVAASNATGLPTSYTLTTPYVAAALAGGSVYGLGAMSTGYGGNGQTETLTYNATADYIFNYLAGSKLVVGLENATYIGSGSVTLGITVTDPSDRMIYYSNNYTFSSLAWAQEFFTDNPIPCISPTSIACALLPLPGGIEDVQISYAFTSSSLNSGFAFNYVVGTTGGTMSPTPLPAALPLFGTGLLGLVALARRRMKQNTAALAAA